MAFPPKVPPRMPFVRKPALPPQMDDADGDETPKPRKGKASPLAEAMRRKKGQQGGC